MTSRPLRAPLVALPSSSCPSNLRIQLWVNHNGLHLSLMCPVRTGAAVPGEHGDCRQEPARADRLELFHKLRMTETLR